MKTENYYKLLKIFEELKEQGVELIDCNDFKDRVVDFSKRSRPELKKEIEEYFDSL